MERRGSHNPQLDIDHFSVAPPKGRSHKMPSGMMQTVLLPFNCSSAGWTSRSYSRLSRRSVFFSLSRRHRFESHRKTRPSSIAQGRAGRVTNHRLDFRES